MATEVLTAALRKDHLVFRQLNADTGNYDDGFSLLYDEFKFAGTTYLEAATTGLKVVNNKKVDFADSLGAAKLSLDSDSMAFVGGLGLTSSQLKYGADALATLSSSTVKMLDSKKVDFADGVVADQLSLSSGSVAFKNGLGLTSSQWQYAGTPLATLDTGKVKMLDGKKVDFADGQDSDKLSLSSGSVVFKGGLGLTSTKVKYNDADYVTFDADRMYVADNKTIRVSKAPSNGFDVANKSYVDGIASGLVVKPFVKWSTNAEVALASSSNTTSFVSNASTNPTTPSVGDRVLVKDQADTRENGIYVVNASGPWTRAADMDTNYDITGTYVYSMDNSRGYIVVSSSASDLVGTHPINFTIFNSRSDTQFGTGLSYDGYTVSIDSSSSGVSGLGSRLTTQEGAFPSTLMTSSGANRVLFVNAAGTAATTDSSFYYDSTGITAVGLTCTSDERLKTNIEEVRNSEVIYHLKPVQYNWKDPNQDQRVKFGFIAQDVEKLLPSVVNNVDDRYGVEYMNFIALLVAEVQKLRSDVDKLSKKD